MKLLTLLRHGKSDWDAPYARDFDRPLKERGRRDAPLMGCCLAALGLLPDLIVSSPARRARKTAELFQEAVDYHGSIRWEETIYGASVGELMAVVRRLPEEAEHVVLVGHNPGLEELSARLIGVPALGPNMGLRLPTAALAHIRLAVQQWRDVQPDSGQLQWLLTPKLAQRIKEG